MAQTAAALVMYTLGDEAHGKVVYFMSVDEARFRKPVVPGDTLKIHVARVRNRRSVWKFSGEARVEEIGRASCRERVCRYVSIWVVVVSLNKKTNIQKLTQ